MKAALKRKAEKKDPTKAAIGKFFLRIGQVQASQQWRD